MNLELYIKENQADFLAKVETISQKLNINPEWLMVVMYAESRLNPQAVNPITNATGLIQFMPATAVNLGTTVHALYRMTNIEQLDYVYRYYKPYRGKLNSVYDLYLSTFFPVALGKSDSWIMHTSRLSAGLIAKQNKVIDIDQNRKITVGEFKLYVDKLLKSKGIELNKFSKKKG